MFFRLSILQFAVDTLFVLCYNLATYLGYHLLGNHSDFALTIPYAI